MWLHYYIESRTRFLRCFRSSEIAKQNSHSSPAPFGRVAYVQVPCG